MINLPILRASDSISLQRVSHCTREIRKLIEILKIHLDGVPGLDEEKPIPAPSHVALYRAPAGHIHRHGGGMAPAADVLHRHPAILRRTHGHDASRRFDFVFAFSQSPEMR